MNTINLRMNSINEFIDECIEFKLKNESDNFNYLRCSEIYIHYKNYCKINNILDLNKYTFIKEFQEQTKLIKIKNSGIMSYKGIIFKTTECIEKDNIDIWIDECIEFKLKNENNNFNYIKVSETFIHFKDYCKFYKDYSKFNGVLQDYKKSEFKIKFENKTGLIPIKNNNMCYKGITWKYIFKI